MSRSLTSLRLAFLAVVTAVSVLPAAGYAQDQSLQLGFHVERGDSLHLRAAAEGGAAFVVVVFSWRDIEPAEGYWYWDQPDATIRGTEYYGLDVVARLDRPPEWAQTGQARTPWRVDAYARFAAEVSARYGSRLDGVILWNEPNLALEWNEGRPDPAGYVELLRAGYNAVKQSSPALPVAMAGLAPTLGDGSLAVNDLEYLEAVYDLGGGAYFDVLALHAYGFGQPPEAPPRAEALNFRRLELQRAIMVEHGDAGKPAWITEMGWRTSAPQRDDAWQVVSPDLQAAYSVQAVEWARHEYAWLKRAAFWEITAGPDKYGYALWEGPGRASPTYAALAAWARELSATSLASSDQENERKDAFATEVEILAQDTIVRLGSVGTLHPHWVHLYRDGPSASLAWKAEFYLADGVGDIGGQAYELLLETMQVNEGTNKVLLNGRLLGRLEPRHRLDPTSTWTTQRFSLPAGWLGTGVNSLEVQAGLRNPALQHGWWRYENLQLRNARLAVVPDAVKPTTEWRRIATPGGWGEVNRLRLGVGPDDNTALWLTTNTAGGLWSAELTDGGAIRLANQAYNRPDLVFTDAFSSRGGEIAATDQGLLWRAGAGEAWTPALGAPHVYTYFAMEVDGSFFAGVEGQGLWKADAAGGPWRQHALEGRSVLDMAYMQGGPPYVTTDRGIFRQFGSVWLPMPKLPSEAYGGNFGKVAGDFVGRLHMTDDGSLIAFNQNRAWVWDGDWQPYGPAALEGKTLGAIGGAEADTRLLTDRLGVWGQVGIDGWQRVDNSELDNLELVGGLDFGDTSLIGATNGLLMSSPDGDWEVVEGMPAAVSDVEVVYDEVLGSSIWLIGTPTGVYRSRTRGAIWERISPPWVVWDLASAGRLYVGRRHGMAWTDMPGEAQPVWIETAGLNGVTFFRVRPDRSDPAIVRGGTWGNNIGLSVDRGQSIAAVGNGLETLSTLDIWQHETEGQFTIGTIEGLYRSDDGGASWFKLPGQLTDQTVYSLLQADDGSLWAGAADGLWVSVDYGATWQIADDVPTSTVLQIGQVDINGKRLMWAGTEGKGLWVSEDGGRSWQLAGLDGLTVYSLAVDQDLLLAATADGLYVVEAEE